MGCADRVSEFGRINGSCSNKRFDNLLSGSNWPGFDSFFIITDNRRRGSLWGLLPLLMKSLFHPNQQSNGAAVSQSIGAPSNFGVKEDATTPILPPPKHGKSVSVSDFEIIKPISRYKIKRKCVDASLICLLQRSIWESVFG
jgi:hypothetical protein